MKILSITNSNKGFSLIELMIVVTIIGILAAVAVPAYQTYVTKAKLSEAVTLLQGFKAEYMEYVIANGTFPNATDLGYNTSGYDVPNPANFYENAKRFVINRQGTTCGNISFEIDTTKIGVTGNLWIGLHVWKQSDGSYYWECGTADNTTQTPDSNLIYLPTQCVKRPDFTGC